MTKRKPTLTQLDTAANKAGEVSRKIWKKHALLLNEYVKTCEHPRRVFSWDLQSGREEAHCAICGKFVETEG
jgi:hypothetical protein